MGSRSALVFAALLMTIGCGRVSYTGSSTDAGPDDGMDAGPGAGMDASVMLDAADAGNTGDAGETADAGDAGNQDAGPSGVDPALITKVTVAAPLFPSPLPTSGDCGQFAMFYVHDDPIDDNDLEPTFFLDPDGHTLWAAMPCKHVDTGWNIGIGRWDTAGGSFELLDGDPVMPARQAFIRIDDMFSDGMPVRSTRSPAFAFAEDGTLHGMAAYYTASAFDDVVPVEAATPLALDSLSFLITARRVFVPPAAPWVARTAFQRSILRVASTFYVYSVHWDGASMTPLGLSNTSIAVSTSTDLRSSTFVASPLEPGWASPRVSSWGGRFHMVARNLATNQWSYVPGSSPTDFDFSRAVSLRLFRFAGGAGAWDEQRFTTHGTSGDPSVPGAIVIGGTLYIFYLAGVPPNGAFATFSQGRGGLGLLTVPVVP